LWDAGKLRAAFKHFVLGANMGDSSAQHNLGYFYRHGVGVTKNRSAALKWYKRAYRQGSRVSASNIANIFRDEKKSTQALLWYRRAIKLHDADANLEIAKIYLSENGVHPKARQYLRRTINAKSADVTRASQQEARLLLKRFLRKISQTQSKKRMAPRRRTKA
jgi:TPR repeat protein